MRLKNKIFIILGILGILIVIIFCNLMPTDNQIRTPIDTVVLTVYGTNAEPIEYSLKDEDIIKLLIQNINSITKQDKLMNENELDKPKGISYKLEFLGQTNYEYNLLYGYCIYDRNVYTIPKYNTYINDLKQKFNCLIQ